MSVEKTKVNSVLNIKKFDSSGRLVLHKQVESRKGVRTEKDIVNLNGGVLE